MTSIRTSTVAAVQQLIPSLLQGEYFLLEALGYQHLEPLLNLAQDSRIWEFFPMNGADDLQHLSVLTQAIFQKESGERYPFVLRCRLTGVLAGYTHLYNIDLPNHKLEAGTWIHPDYWGSSANLESKLLLLRYCFANLKMLRVQFKTAPNNLRSRKALEKLGASFEGILRNDRVLTNGESRDSAVYSIIAEEWPAIEKQLISQIVQLQQPQNFTFFQAFLSPKEPFQPSAPDSQPGLVPNEKHGLLALPH